MQITLCSNFYVLLYYYFSTYVSDRSKDVVMATVIVKVIARLVSEIFVQDLEDIASPYVHAQDRNVPYVSIQHGLNAV